MNATSPATRKLTPAGNSLLLAETLPAGVSEAFAALPQRLIFQNACIQLVLIGLRPGQALPEFASPVPLVLVVTFGSVAIRAGGMLARPVEGEPFRLEAGVNYLVRALEGADLLFYIPLLVEKTAAPACDFLSSNRERQRKPAIVNDKPAAAVPVGNR